MNPFTKKCLWLGPSFVRHDKMHLGQLAKMQGLLHLPIEWLLLLQQTHLPDLESAMICVKDPEEMIITDQHDLH